MKLIYSLALMLCGIAHADPIVFQSSDRQTALLELYTSESCSSCPPADSWLSKLKNDPGLWQTFIPIAFHVDYWNHLGWRDRFSDERFTERQQNYARLWSTENIYTPEFVLNGQEWHDWFGFRGAPASGTAKAGVVQASSLDGEHWQVNFLPAETETTGYEVTATVLANGLSSDVNAGENSGRHLNHDFAALSLITRPLLSQTNRFEGQFIIDKKPKGIAGRLAVVIWVTRTGQLEPLQATGGWLPTPQNN